MSKTKLLPSVGATALAAALLCAGVTAPAAVADGSRSVAQGTRAYIVVLRPTPVASYHGSLPGFPATAPPPGSRFSDDRPVVTAYRDRLKRQQLAILRRIGSPPTLYSYTTALDGFAARLDGSQVEALHAMPSVLLVQPDTRLHVDATRARKASMLSFTRPPAADGSLVAHRQLGRGAVIGIIDTGVAPENPSLAGVPTGVGAQRRTYPGFTGHCQGGARWTPSTCTSKVIAARWYVRGFGPSKVATSDYISPRDSVGHGTAVASLAAGNAGIEARIAGQALGRLSGVAPGAALSVYKACWAAPDPAYDGCDMADVVAAIDQAVRDGVDVISDSISGSGHGLANPVDTAFLNAAAANVFVATSAGNGGPRPGSVQHASPWVTTVGANTHNVFQGGVRLGNGTTYVGAMLSGRDVGPTRLVYAADAAAQGVSRARAALCFPDSLDAQRVDGAIVVCDRGATPRVSKSAEVARSGGVGMVLVNTSRGSIEADLHAVPTVHLDEAAGRAVKAYVARRGRAATAALVASATDHPPIPTVAGFSGRGPVRVADGDILEPDVTAPGVDVIAATTSLADPNRRWDVQSGTSVAAPQVAGLAADIRSIHPGWTPAMIKSAVMTTAAPLRGPNDPLTRGAGTIDETAALQPGLVYESGRAGWLRLLRAETVASATDLRRPRAYDGSNLNAAAIAIGDLVGQETVVRRVTNVGRRTDTYTAGLAGLRGLATSVDPVRITLGPGQSRWFTVTFSATDHARYGAYAFGSLTWRDAAGRVVASPIAVRPELAATPSDISASGRSGSVAIRGMAGVTGTLTPRSTGLVGATPVRVTLQPGAFDPRHPSSSSATAVETLSVPPGAIAARFEITSGSAADAVDAYVYRGTRLVASQTARSSDKVITLRAPAAGRYRVYVHALDAGSDGGTVRATISSWVLPAADQDNLTLDPRSLGVNGGETFAIQASWARLSPKKRWWGIVSYRGLPAVTSLTIN